MLGLLTCNSCRLLLYTVPGSGFGVHSTHRRGSTASCHPRRPFFCPPHSSFPLYFFFFSSRRRHTRCLSDWSSDVCSSDLLLRRQGHRNALSRASTMPLTSKKSSSCASVAQLLGARGPTIAMPTWRRSSGGGDRKSVV